MLGTRKREALIDRGHINEEPSTHVMKQGEYLYKINPAKNCVSNPCSTKDALESV
jgi:hypothetical protein